MPSFQDSMTIYHLPRPPFASAHCDQGYEIPALRALENVILGPKGRYFIALVAVSASERRPG
jgi:hypothetical protein